MMAAATLIMRCGKVILMQAQKLNSEGQPEVVVLLEPLIFLR